MQTPAVFHKVLFSRLRSPHALSHSDGSEIIEPVLQSIAPFSPNTYFVEPKNKKNVEPKNVNLLHYENYSINLSHKIESPITFHFAESTLHGNNPLIWNLIAVFDRWIEITISMSIITTSHWQLAWVWSYLTVGFLKEVAHVAGSLLAFFFCLYQIFCWTVFCFWGFFIFSYMKMWYTLSV